MLDMACCTNFGEKRIAIGWEAGQTGFWGFSFFLWKKGWAIVTRHRPRPACHRELKSCLQGGGVLGALFTNNDDLTTTT